MRKEIFDAMCRIEYEKTKTDEPPPEDETEEETETESESETETETEEEKEPDVKVTIYRMTAEEAAEFYDFSDEEIEQMVNDRIMMSSYYNVEEGYEEYTAVHYRERG